MEDIIERFIYPVGFGAFFLEKFCSGTENELFVVYDCGSKSKGGRKYIKAIIDKEIPKVDILFVSHLHEDHINCIKELPITENTIVALPYIYDGYQILYEYINGMAFSSLQKYLIGRGAKIIYVDPLSASLTAGQGLNIVRRNNEVSYDLGKDIANGAHIHSFANLKLSIKNRWLFIPLHLQDKTIYNQFISNALATGITTAQLAHFDGKDKALTSRLINIYAETCGRENVYVGFNSSSMLLVSRPEEEGKYEVSLEKYSPFSRFPKFEVFSNPGCLYTGDIPLNYQPYCAALRSLYSELMPFGIGTVQLPHHGSVNGYHPFLYNDNEVKAVFCNCIDKPSGHKPVLLFKAVLEAWLNSKVFFAVTGDNDTRLEFKIK